MTLPNKQLVYFDVLSIANMRLLPTPTQFFTLAADWTSSGPQPCKNDMNRKSDVHILQPQQGT